MSGKRSLTFGLGALVPASGVVATWICCLPLASAGLGLGAAALGVALAPFRPYFLAMSVALLSAAFFYAYRPRREACTEGASCRASAVPGRQQWLLWALALLTVGLVTIDRWGSWVIYWAL